MRGKQKPSSTTELKPCGPENWQCWMISFFMVSPDKLGQTCEDFNCIKQSFSDGGQTASNGVAVMEDHDKIIRESALGNL